MKTFPTLILILILTVSTNAQEIIFDFSTKAFIPSEITLTNGSVLNGFIRDFSLPKSVEFRGLGYEFNSIESKLFLDRRTFKYRASEEGETKIMDLDDITSILLKGEDTIRYEKLKLKTINTKNEVIDLNKEVIMPLLREGPINLYGLGVSHCREGCQMIFVIVYIKNVNQDYAYIPIDYNRINFFNIGSLDDKFFKSFAEAGSDCPEFLEYLETVEQRFANKDIRKDYKTAYKEFQKEKKEKLKEIKGVKNKRKAENDMDTAYFLKFYTDIIDEYTSFCDY